VTGGSVVGAAVGAAVVGTSAHTHAHTFVLHTPEKLRRARRNKRSLDSASPHSCSGGVSSNRVYDEGRDSQLHTSHDFLAYGRYLLYSSTRVTPAKRYSMMHVHDGWCGQR